MPHMHLFKKVLVFIREWYLASSTLVRPQAFQPRLPHHPPLRDCHLHLDSIVLLMVKIWILTSFLIISSPPCIPLLPFHLRPPPQLVPPTMPALFQALLTFAESLVVSSQSLRPLSTTIRLTLPPTVIILLFPNVPTQPLIAPVLSIVLHTPLRSSPTLLIFFALLKSAHPPPDLLPLEQPS